MMNGVSKYSETIIVPNRSMISNFERATNLSSEFRNWRTKTVRVTIRFWLGILPEIRETGGATSIDEQEVFLGQKILGDRIFDLRVHLLDFIQIRSKNQQIEQAVLLCILLDHKIGRNEPIGQRPPTSPETVPVVASLHKVDHSEEFRTHQSTRVQIFGQHIRLEFRAQPVEIRLPLGPSREQEEKGFVDILVDFFESCQKQVVAGHFDPLKIREVLKPALSSVNWPDTHSKNDNWNSLKPFEYTRKSMSSRSTSTLLLGTSFSKSLLFRSKQNFWMRSPGVTNELLLSLANPFN